MTEPPVSPDDRLTDVDAFDLHRLISALRQGWLIILCCAAAAVLVEAVSLHDAAPIYRVEMEVAAIVAPPAAPDVAAAAPRREQHGEQHGSRRPGVTPIAFTLYLESLRTRDVADALAKDPEVAKALPPDAGPQPAGGVQVQRYLLSQLSVNQDQRKHTFAILRLQTPRPDAAMHLLLALHQAADDHMRSLALSRARQMIADLTATPNTDANPEIAQVLAEQQRIEGAALSTAPFAAQRIGGPATDPKPLNRPVKSLVAALIAGGAVGVVIALLYAGFAASRRAVRGGGVPSTWP